jgi:LmbE family N-acetylglucosaminyl deacetylase
MPDRPLRLLILGAHPDDADYAAGGLAALYRSAGHDVLMVSLTNGDAGHHAVSGPALAARRAREAAAAAAVIGARYLVLDNHDGELLPTLDNRREIIGLMRTYEPDLVLTHRPNDYHPDHRYTSQLVQDAAYMVTVPAVLPGTRHLSHNPVIMYLPDTFEKPYPFRPAVGVDVGPVVDRIAGMLDCHRSQFYEWLPYNTGTLDRVPATDDARRAWITAQVQARLREQADRFRAALIATYGPERGGAVEFAEAFEPCEYGAPFDDAVRRRLFPFVPA